MVFRAAGWCLTVTSTSGAARVPYLTRERRRGASLAEGATGLPSTGAWSQHGHLSFHGHFCFTGTAATPLGRATSCPFLLRPTYKGTNFSAATRSIRQSAQHCEPAVCAHQSSDAHLAQVLCHRMFWRLRNVCRRASPPTPHTHTHSLTYTGCRR